MLKICRVCNIEKDISSYFVRGKGHRTECKSCLNEIKKKNRKITSLKKLDPNSEEYKKLKSRNDKSNKARAKTVKANNLAKLKVNLLKPIRKCACCKEEKPKEEFDKYKSERYKRVIFRSRCRECLKIARNAKYKTDKGIFKSYKYGARKRSYNFNLEFEHFSKLINSPCYYCGDENSRGVDRKNNSTGYEVKNSIPCCNMCNIMKGTNDFDSFIEKCKLIASRN